MGISNNSIIKSLNSFFVLRNNDLGDVLVATPLLKGLKKAFPESKVSIGVGDWARPLLENNPHVNEVISCNAPWHNKQNCRFPANSPKTFLEGLLYVLLSKESRYISAKKFTHGIDVLGSRQGSWLMRKSNIQNRFGVKGYAGGDKWCTKFIDFKEERKVAEAGLEFLNLINTEVDIDPRPTIFLTKNEVTEAEAVWGERSEGKKRIVLAPGGGFPEKCWGDKNFTELTNFLLKNENYKICIIGCNKDEKRISANDSSQLTNLCGKLNLRQSAAMVSAADFVICNSSLCMHLAGAFRIPSLTLLGEWYDSAELHQKQWGYPETTVKGKELKALRNQTYMVPEAYELILQGLEQTNLQN
ncbi:glycosyltransferase family 9 protein [bacterium]|nr:glycosyltransferase family 9 protein [bacterium]